jgi:hypothetical protein
VSGGKVKAHYTRHGKQSEEPRAFKDSQKEDFCNYCYPVEEQQSEIFRQFFQWAADKKNLSATLYTGQSITYYVNTYRLIQNKGNKSEIKDVLKRFIRSIYFTVPRVDFNGDIEAIYQVLVKSYTDYTDTSGLDLTPSEFEESPILSPNISPNLPPQQSTSTNLRQTTTTSTSVTLTPTTKPKTVISATTTTATASTSYPIDSTTSYYSKKPDPLDLDVWEKNAQAEYNYYGFNPEVKPTKIGSERVNLEDLDISPLGSDNEEFWNQIHRKTQPRNKTPTL